MKSPFAEERTAFEETLSTKREEKVNRLKKNKIRVDVLLFVATLALNLHKLSGDAIHEWIGIAFIPVLIWHLLLNWDWIVGSCRKFFGPIPAIVRFNWIWDFLLYFVIAGTIFSGILISRVFLTSLGVSIENDPFMSFVHKRFSAWLIIMTGIHLGVHYRWIFGIFRREDASEKSVENAERKELSE